MATSAPPLSYRLLIRILWPLVAIYSLYHAYRVADFRYFWQRLGWKIPFSKKPIIWLHCASVGEVRAVSALIVRLQQDFSSYKLVVSTVTTTGAAQANQLYGKSVKHVYLPFDSTASVRRFIRRMNPSAALIVETEIWPNLFAAIEQKNVPLVIVNGRLGQKTLNAPRWLKRIYKNAMQRVTAILARSSQDAAGFESLGAAPDVISVTGNLKLSNLQHLIQKDYPNLISRPYWLAASTHHNEEQMLAEHCLLNSTLLVMAPRHPQRLETIEKQFGQLNIRYCVRSRNEPVEPDTQIYIADTLGELNPLIKHAKIVFMGGSLVPVGGHNLLEPAALGRPVVSGSHLDNFKAETDLLMENSAMLIVENPQELANAVEALIENPKKRTELGKAASRCVAGGERVLAVYLETLDRII